MSSSARRLRLICLFSSFFFLFFFFFQASLFISKLVECCGAEEEAENCSSPKSSDAVGFFLCLFVFFFYHNWQLGSTHCEEERRQIHGLDGESNIKIQTQRFQGIGHKLKRWKSTTSRLYRRLLPALINLQGSATEENSASKSELVRRLALKNTKQSMAYLQICELKPASLQGCTVIVNIRIALFSVWWCCLRCEVIVSVAGKRRRDWFPFK